MLYFESGHAGITTVSVMVKVDYGLELVSSSRT